MNSVEHYDNIFTRPEYWNPKGPYSGFFSTLSLKNARIIVTLMYYCAFMFTITSPINILCTTQGVQLLCQP